MVSLATRHIGGLTVSALGLGCMGMSPVYGRPDVTEARATLRHAVERGVTLFDTADVYGAGGNERLLGEVLPPYRDRITIATKTGIVALPALGLPVGVNGRPARIKRSIDASLRRLRTDHVDLYYLHRADPKIPIEESIGAMSELVTAGKVRFLGVSEVTADQLRRAHATHPIAATQMEWSLFSRESEAEVVPTARELGIAVVAYSPLGRGMLTGSPQATTDLAWIDFRRFLPRWRRANLATNLAAVEQVKAVAAELGTTPAAVALAWLLAKGENVVPIPGTKRRSNLDKNLAALDTTLRPQDLATLDTIAAAGERH